MGKLTTAQADHLTNNGVLTKKARTQMENKGLITTKHRITQYHIQIGPNQFVSPKMYISGLRDVEVDETTQKTIEAIRTGLFELLKQHCVTNTTTTTTKGE